MSKSEDLLSKEFDYYLRHQKELVKQYNGKFIVIKNQEVIGEYSSEAEAFEKTIQQGHKVGTFLIQKCESGKDSYTQVFHSRVTFV